MAKAPNYDAMSYDELTECAAAFRARQIELGDMLDADMPAAERLPLELERGEIRAHLNVIQPLRSAFLVEQNALRSAEVQRFAGMTDEEFDAHVAKMRELRQHVAVGDGPEGATHEPGA